MGGEVLGALGKALDNNDYDAIENSITGLFDTVGAGNIESESGKEYKIATTQDIGLLVEELKKLHETIMDHQFNRAPYHVEQAIKKSNIPFIGKENCDYKIAA